MMPYIKPTNRPKYEVWIKGILKTLKDEKGDFDPGDLNYVLFRIAKGLCTPPRYYKINAVYGVLQCMAFEFYRRVVAPYEDEKIRENGDVE